VVPVYLVGVTATFEWGWDALVAIGTLGLAGVTAWLAWTTRSLATAATEDQRARMAARPHR